MPNRPTPPIPSFKEIPGFDIFVMWLDQRFSGLEEDVGGLVQCVETGNGKPSLKAQIARNTEFRNSIQDEKRDAAKARRSSFLALGVSILLVLLNICLAFFKAPGIAGGG